MNWKTIIVLVIVIVIGMLFLSKLIEPPNTEAIRVTLEIEEINNTIQLKRVNASLIDILKKDVQKGDDMIIFPSVGVYIIQDMHILSYNRFLPYNGTGVYETDLGLGGPVEGDIVRVAVDVYNNNGTGIVSAYADVPLNKS